MIWVKYSFRCDHIWSEDQYNQVLWARNINPNARIGEKAGIINISLMCGPEDAAIIKLKYPTAEIKNDLC
jgi:hypothetical protein